ncbi:MAG: hypothetical protein QOF18_1990 [Frankiaceae bacterium]|jgi:hypothetical protein|nr:hypothetical protein [Frankiaceae bacterium]
MVGRPPKSRVWAAPHHVDPVDRLAIEAANLSHITVDVDRAHITCGATVTVRSDGPLAIRFPGCHQSIHVGAGQTTRRLRIA